VSREVLFLLLLSKENFQRGCRVDLPSTCSDGARPISCLTVTLTHLPFALHELIKTKRNFANSIRLTNEDAMNFHN